MTPDRAVRTVLALSTGRSVLLLTSCADRTNVRLGPSEGADLTSGLTGGEGLLLFVVAPLGLLLLLAALVWLPGMVRSTRYRSGKGWGAPPVWFAGPPDPVAAVETAEPGREQKGGASGSW